MKGKRIDYRHFIALGITAMIIVVVCLCFWSSVVRAGQSFKDFGLSVAFYFTKIFGVENVTVTVNDIPDGMDLTDLLPFTWDEFRDKAAAYGAALINVDNITAYLSVLFEVFYWFFVVLAVVILPLVAVLFIVFKMFGKSVNNKYGHDTKPLKAWKKISAVTVFPVKRFFVSMHEFFVEHRKYMFLWIFLAALGLNIVTVIVEALAYYFYFAVSFDVGSLYRQFYKLVVDLSVLGRVPVIVWLIAVIVVLNVIRKYIGYSRLERLEGRNRAFIGDLPIVSMLVAPMGYGKTTQLVDMALSAEIMLRDKALELLLKNDLLFPAFPWILFEKELERAMTDHVVYNLATCRRYVRSCREQFERYNEDEAVRKAVDKRYIKRGEALPAALRCFGYDFKRNAMTADDGLSVRLLWDVLETYAQLYLIYTVESSMIISNLGIRTDGVLTDLGNFPLWNNDLFRRDSHLMDALSRHSHILDFDMLRLGKKMIERNAKSNAFEFGVLIMTEVGKERGNMLETSEMKKSDEEANQKNDRFNEWMKMIRHSATVDNFPFVKVMMDEQRAMSLGADARELAYIIEIEETGELRLAMPFFQLGEILHAVVGRRFAKWYEDFRYRRGDNTLVCHFLKWLAAAETRHYERIYNTFSYKRVSVKMQNGSLEGESKERKYYIMPKKIYSKRFSTDAYADFFYEKAIRSEVGIEDLEEYESERATLSELEAQHSYFIGNLMKNFELDDKPQDRAVSKQPSRINGKNP